MNKTGRIALVVTGAITASCRHCPRALRAASLYTARWERDDDGYLTSETHRFAGDTRALATENLDLDLNFGKGVIEAGDLGKLRLEAKSRDDKQLFVGIARTSDVERYLGGVPHTTVD